MRQTRWQRRYQVSLRPGHPTTLQRCTRYSWLLGLTIKLTGARPPASEETSCVPGVRLNATLGPAARPCRKKANEINQKVGNHVADQIASPKIEQSKNYRTEAHDNQLCTASVSNVPEDKDNHRNQQG
jgi:hypothetical protein